MRKKLLFCLVVVGVTIWLLSCSGSKPLNRVSAAVPDISGSWEMVATSSANSSVRVGIELALKEGQTLQNGVQQANGQVSASGPAQISFVTLDATTLNIESFGGTCPVAPSGDVNDLAGTVTDLGGAFNFTFHEAGNLFNVAASLGADGQSLIGTYTASSGASCNESGAITGIRVPKISGIYSGQLQMADSSTATVSATLSQNSSGLSAGLVVTNPDDTSYSLTLSGPVTGNAFILQGTLQGKSVTYEGYYESIFNENLLMNVPSVFLVDATDPVHPFYAGTLAVPTQ